MELIFRVVSHQERSCWDGYAVSDNREAAAASPSAFLSRNSIFQIVPLFWAIGAKFPDYSKYKAPCPSRNPAKRLSRFGKALFTISKCFQRRMDFRLQVARQSFWKAFAAAQHLSGWSAASVAIAKGIHDTVAVFLLLVPVMAP